MDTCSADFERLAATVGGIDCQDSGLLSLRNPFDLTHSTMPLIELALIVGAVATLVHALRVRRDHGIGTNLIVWWAATLCPLLLEPIVYFPETFGIQNIAGLTFIHNQFTVTFLFNRLPLYIIAMYPVFIYVAFLVAQRAGLRIRHHPVVGACAVAFTFVVLYEVIDQVGPHLQWWVWNYDAPSGLPKIGAVPSSSITGFSIGVPFSVAFLAMWTTRASHDHLVRKIAAVTIGGILGMLVLGLPTRLYDVVLAQDTATAAGTATLFLLCGLGTAWGFRPAWRRDVPASTEDLGDPEGRFLRRIVSAYFALGAVVWAVDLLGEPAGQPGSVAIAAAGAATSAVLVAGADRIARRAHDVTIAQDGAVAGTRS